MNIRSSGRRRRGVGITIAILAALSLALVAVRSITRDVDDLVGIRLPAGAENVQVDLRRHFLGEYKAYLRFDVAPGDARQLLSSPGMQSKGRGDDPMVVFEGAWNGQQPVSAVVVRERPSWWQPEESHTFSLAYRSTTGSSLRGPDLAWFIVDTSDAGRYTVYVYMIEV